MRNKWSWIIGKSTMKDCLLAVGVSWLMAGCISEQAEESATETGVSAETSISTTTYSTPFTDERLVFGKVIECDTPADTISYTESAAAWGLIAGENTNTPSDFSQEYGALGVSDLDQDGHLDLVVGLHGVRPTLYWGTETGFESASYVGDLKSINNIGVADLNGDGFPDLITTGEPLPGGVNSSVALLTQPNRSFEKAEIPPFSKDWPAAHHVQELIPNDIDHDGDIDFYAMMAGAADKVFFGRTDVVLWNDGDANFTVDETYLDSKWSVGKGFDGLWFDADADGDLDMYVCNDFGPLYGGNVLLKDVGGAHVADPDCDCDAVHFCMGVDVGDVNHDGRPDIFLTDGTTHKLLQALDDGTYVDVAASMNAAHINGQPEMAFGAIFLDHDNDGDQDLMLAMGIAAGDWKDEFGDGIVLLSQDKNSFIELGEFYGLDQGGNYRAVVSVDFNGDGVLDLLVSEIVQRPKLYLSDSCTANGWIRVEAPYGSRVEVTANGDRWVDWVTEGSSQASSQPAAVHIGLGLNETIDSIQVVTPGGVGKNTSVDSITLLHVGEMKARRAVTVDLSKK